LPDEVFEYGNGLGKAAGLERVGSLVGPGLDRSRVGGLRGGIGSRSHDQQRTENNGHRQA
jgi:hypothetical protein